MKKKSVRKPRDLSSNSDSGMYAGCHFNWSPPIYVCGDYYHSNAQINLSCKEAKRLGKWLLKAAEYLEAKGRK